MLECNRATHRLNSYQTKPLIENFLLSQNTTHLELNDPVAQKHKELKNFLGNLLASQNEDEYVYPYQNPDLPIRPCFRIEGKVSEILARQFTRAMVESGNPYEVLMTQMARIATVTQPVDGVDPIEQEDIEAVDGMDHFSIGSIISANTRSIQLLPHEHSTQSLRLIVGKPERLKEIAGLACLTHLDAVYNFDVGSVSYELGRGVFHYTNPKDRLQLKNGLYTPTKWLNFVAANNPAQINNDLIVFRNLLTDMAS